MAQEVTVTSLDQLSNDKTYFIESGRCFLMYNTTANADGISTSTATNLGTSTVAKDWTDANQQFKIENIDGSYYLYSVGAAKYVTKNGGFSDTATDALGLTPASDATYNWMLTIGGNGMNSQEPNNMATGITVNNWTTEDPGNRYKIIDTELSTVVVVDYPNEFSEFNQNKCYTVSTTSRSAWAVSNDRFCSTKDAGLGTSSDPTDANQQFAVLSNDGENYYLYSVGAKKFVKSDKSLIASRGEAIELADASAVGAGRVRVNFKGYTNKYINLGGSMQMVINEYSSVDAGNAVAFIEAGDFDPTEALEMLNNATITYNFTYEGNVVATQEVIAVLGKAYPDYTLSAPYGVTGAAKPEGTVSDDETVTIELTITKALPFEAVASGTPTKWYYAQIHGNNLSYMTNPGVGAEMPWKVNGELITAVDEANADSYTWGFVGDLWTGFKVVSKAGGAIKSTGSGNVTIVENIEDATAFIAMTPQTNGNAQAENGFCLLNAIAGKYMNAQNSGINHYSENDAGSTIIVSEREPVAKIGETKYMTLADAVAAAEAGQTVVLLKDTEETLVLPAGVKLDKSNVTAPNVNEAAAKVGETLYASIEAAAAAAQAGQTVVLLKETDETLVLPAGVKLDKNGFTAPKVSEAPTVAEVATLAELQAALAAENELPIIITETIVIPEGETVVLDLNGKTVTRQDEATKYAINNLGTLTIQDTKGNGSINARGIYNGYGNGGANVATAKITVVNGTINAKGTDGGGAAIFNYGVADIQGGTFTSVASYAIALQTGSTMTIGENAIITGGINSWQSTLTITGGTISNDKSGKHVVYAGESAVTINGGTFHNNNSGNATILASGSTAAVEITGGTFTLNIVDASSSYLIDATSSATYTISGGSFTGGIRAQGGTKYEITGGTFTNEYGNYNVYEGGDINISGGTFTGSYAQKFATDNLADGYELDENGTVVQVNYVAKIGEQGYATLSAAFAAVTDDAQTVVVLQDVTEELTGAYLRGNITTENGAKVTINLTNSDWVYCPYTFVLGENITLNVPALFYYAGSAQINGAVITDAYYQRYAGTKLTINEPGSLTVTGETFIIRYTDSDANAGIYVNGDNNDETVGLNLSVAYFYQGMIYAKDANIKTSVYWQTNETDGQGSANLVLDNSTLNVTVNEHNFKATGNSTVTLTNGSSIVIAGAFETGSKTVVSVDATSSIIDKNGKVKFGLSGEGTEANPYLISSVDDLVLFRNSVNAGETKYSAPGIYVALGADIDLAGENWIGIGSMTADHGFMGNFDGKNFKIKNLTIDNPALDSDGYAYAGLFALTEGTDKDNQNFVKNLTIENVTINTTGHIASAAIAYAYYTVVDNVTVCGNIAINGGDYTAGVLAYTRRCVNASNIAIIGNENSYVNGARVVGGVISDIQMNGGLIADYSNFSAEGVAVSGTGMVGGISGIIATQTLDGATVKNVTLNSNDGRVGIVAGCFGGTSTISNVASENVAGTTAIVGPTYNDSKAVEARIGDTYYATLQTAVAAAKENETVTLLADVEATEALNINCALDLNRHSLTATVAPTALPEGYAALPNLDGKFVIGAQPTATVNNLDRTTVAAGDYSIWNGSFDQNTEDDGDMPLSFVMQFLADQDAEAVAASPYANWYGDFVITFTGLENGSFTADGCYLAGHYGSFGWVKVPVDGMLIEEGVRYPVMLGVGMGIDYKYICSDVEDFKCALYLTPEILAANPNIKVNLELGIVDSSKEIEDARDALINNENVYSVKDYTYDADDFVVDPNYIAELTIDDAAGENYTNDTEKTVGTLTYKRTLVNGKWNALYLPFEIELTDELLANYDFADYNQMISRDTNGDRVPDSFEMELFIYTSGTLDANYPYFVRPKNEEACSMNLVLTDATLYPANEISLVTTSVKNTFKLSGTYKAMGAEELDGKYAISIDGDWSYTSALKPYRLYFTITDNNGAVVTSVASKSVRIVVRGEDGYTGVEGVESENGEEMIFDLQGRRVLEPEKGGLYIINGKKVMVK